MNYKYIIALCVYILFLGKSFGLVQKLPAGPTTIEQYDTTIIEMIDGYSEKKGLDKALGIFGLLDTYTGILLERIENTVYDINTINTHLSNTYLLIMLLEKEHGNSLPKEVITSLEEIQEGYHILALYSSALQSIEEGRIDNCKETLSDINSMQHSKSYFDGEMKSFRTPKQVKLDELMKDPSFNSRFRALVSRYIPLDDVVYATNSFCETQSAYKNNDITYCAAIPERQNCISKLSIYNDEQRLCNYLLEDKLGCNIKFAKSRIDPTYCIDEKNGETYTSCLFDIENLIKRGAQMSKNFELTSCERITKDSTKTFCKRIYYEGKDSIEQCKHRFYDNQISSCYSNRYINQAQKKLDHNYCLKSGEYKQESMSYSSINSCLMKVAEKTFDTDICKNIKEEYSFTISRCIANTKISEYIKNEHQGEKVQGLNRIGEPIRISLSNGTTLNFDLEGNIIN